MMKRLPLPVLLGQEECLIATAGGTPILPSVAAELYLEVLDQSFDHAKLKKGV